MPLSPEDHFAVIDLLAAYARAIDSGRADDYADNFLPDAILKKRKHGFGVPVGRWMRDHAPLRDLAYDSMRSLEARGYLREQFVSDLMRLHQSDHADYYGVMVYVLTMLELWHRGVPQIGTERAAPPPKGGGFARRLKSA